MVEEDLAQDMFDIVAKVDRPDRVVVTGGMPYANGLLHVGHLAGALIPPDVYARWYRMLLGEERVLFVCGTDDHGSASELAARKAGKSVTDFVADIRNRQKATLDRYNISLDIYSGTSAPENYVDHKVICDDLLRRLYKNQMLEKRASEQWYDAALSLFLADRYVIGTCPHCGYTNAYSEQCDSCGGRYEDRELINPVSSISSTTPVLRSTEHWWLDMWRVVDQLKSWIETKEKVWRKVVYTEALGQVVPCLVFSNKDEKTFKDLKPHLPRHKSRYAAGKRIVVAFENLAELEQGKLQLEGQGVAVEFFRSWAQRSITRDISWGVPIPEDLDEGMKGKTFYVWPESLIAPVAFTRLALKKKGLDPEKYRDYWCNPDAKIAQFVGTDNVFFYVVMQGAMWFGSQEDPLRMPVRGELQLSDVYANCHLLINGEKMSKSTGNFYTADELLDEYGFSADHVRYYLSQLSLSKKQSNFDLEILREKVAFLTGPLNSAFERPISAAHSKFESRVPQGAVFIDKVVEDTKKMVEIYLRSMQRAEYPDLLFLIENYARIINKLFTNYKPHDDRFPEKERRDALYSSFYVLKNLIIMLYPFVPVTIDRVRESLLLPKEVFRVEELGTPIEGGHVVGDLQNYF
jgi:methionyl-tRNA synthetase